MANLEAPPQAPQGPTRVPRLHAHARPVRREAQEGSRKALALTGASARAAARAAQRPIYSDTHQHAIAEIRMHLGTLSDDDAAFVTDATFHRSVRSSAHAARPKRRWGRS